MELNAKELDLIIVEIIGEHNAGGLHPTREEIAQSVLDYIRSHIDAHVAASLERLIRDGKIDENRDATRGRPYIYSLPKIRRRPLS